MKFFVTQKDIDNGKGGDCHNCPIALAIIRQAKVIDVNVGPRYIVVAGEQYNYTNEVSEWIETFDFLGKHKVGPITVTLEKVNAH